jgi:hypothetical protein
VKVVILYHGVVSGLIFVNFLHAINPLKSQTLKKWLHPADRIVMKIATLIFLLLSTPLWARSPAVEPVTGISIEEYKEVDSKNAKGYDFTRHEITNVEQTSSESDLSVATTIFLILASALPFVVWFGVMRALPDASEEHQKTTQTTPTFSVIKGEGSDDHNDDDDHDSWPNAS